MKRILITGGTGLVGSELVDYYLANNDEVYVLTRSDRDSNNTSLYYINWSKDNWEKAIPKIDVVINLAGASLMNRWTEDYKETIMNSRIESTNRLFKFFEAQDYAPEVLFNASAVIIIHLPKLYLMTNMINSYLMTSYLQSLKDGKKQHYYLKN